MASAAVQRPAGNTPRGLGAHSSEGNSKAVSQSNTTATYDKATPRKLDQHTSLDHGQHEVPVHVPLNRNRTVHAEPPPTNQRQRASMPPNGQFPGGWGNDGSSGNGSGSGNGNGKGNGDGNGNRDEPVVSPSPISVSFGGGGGGGGGLVGWRWNCCCCTTGLNQSYIYDISCNDCGHQRDSCCEMYISK
ncbi:hypothetical protein F5Y13DRAFT_34749 [Hypoxylon sp. FL1857]|nr:hypothetical protein F5Y13DRAFT_34749 [Hypoxylon sp. FL1857]